MYSKKTEHIYKLIVWFQPQIKRAQCLSLWWADSRVPVPPSWWWSHRTPETIIITLTIAELLTVGRYVVQVIRNIVSLMLNLKKYNNSNRLCSPYCPFSIFFCSFFCKKVFLIFVWAPSPAESSSRPVSRPASNVTAFRANKPQGKRPPSAAFMERYKVGFRGSWVVIRSLISSSYHFSSYIYVTKTRRLLF